MPEYWRAYELRTLRAFRGWCEPRTGTSDGSQRPLHDDTIVYLGEDFVVRVAPFADATAIFTDTSREWHDYCVATLHHRTPDWADEAAAVRRAVTGA